MDPIQFELLLHAVCASETAIPLINTYTEQQQFWHTEMATLTATRA